LCDYAGFCEYQQWYDNCVGQWGYATPNGIRPSLSFCIGDIPFFLISLFAADGSGVSLSYPGGEFGRTGVVNLVCNPQAGPIGNITIGNVRSIHFEIIVIICISLS